MEKEKVQAVKNNPMKLLKMYNKLCKSCKIKSVMAIKRGNKATNNIINKYCDKCKTMLNEEWAK